MATQVTTSYQNKYDEFHMSLKNNPQPPCDQLKLFRILVVSLTQEKNTYWRRPCLRDYPCIWEQHRSNIDKQIECLSPLEKDLERECKAYTQVKMAEKVSKLQATGGAGGSAEARIGHNITNVFLPPVDKV